MSKSVRNVTRDRIPQAQLDALIQRVEPQEIERAPVAARPVLFSDIEYDTLHPQETIRNFCASIREMLSKYQYDKDQYAILENEMQDILHYVEMTKSKNANAGFKIYDRLREVRRQRRTFQNEMELLQPIYDAFGGGDKLNILAQIQGAVGTIKQAIDNRAYTVRTDILDQFTEK